jgi:hypothetical protein
MGSFQILQNSSFIYNHTIWRYSLNTEIAVGIKQSCEIPLLDSEVICADRQVHVYTINKIAQ